MQIYAVQTDSAKPSRLRRLLAKTFLLNPLAQQHYCNVPDQDYSPVATRNVPRAGTYSCCECGQHWRNQT
jgi:hypothetical protein